MDVLAHVFAALCLVSYLGILVASRGAIHEVYGAVILLCAGVFWIGGLLISRANRIVELLEGRAGQRAAPFVGDAEAKKVPPKSKFFE
jgi:hypothetical protein